MGSLKEDELDLESIKCFTKGLISVAKVDGVTEQEKRYISEFYNSTTDNSNDLESLFDDKFSTEEAKECIYSDELKEYFFKSCIMLACVDSFTDGEKKLIRSYAEELNYSEKIEKMIHDVQMELLAQFSNVELYKDSLKEIVDSVGGDDNIINELKHSKV